MQGADPAAGSAESEKSRTESEGQARPLFLADRGALAQPKHALPANHEKADCKCLQTGMLFGDWPLRQEVPPSVCRGKKMQLPAHWPQHTAASLPPLSYRMAGQAQACTRPKSFKSGKARRESLRTTSSAQPPSALEG